MDRSIESEKADLDRLWIAYQRDSSFDGLDIQRAFRALVQAAVERMCATDRWLSVVRPTLESATAQRLRRALATFDPARNRRKFHVWAFTQYWAAWREAADECKRTGRSITYEEAGDDEAPSFVQVASRQLQHDAVAEVRRDKERGAAADLVERLFGYAAESMSVFGKRRLLWRLTVSLSEPAGQLPWPETPSVQQVALPCDDFLRRRLWLRYAASSSRA